MYYQPGWYYLYWASGRALMHHLVEASSELEAAERGAIILGPELGYTKKAISSWFDENRHPRTKTNDHWKENNRKLVYHFDDGHIEYSQ